MQRRKNDLIFSAVRLALTGLACVSADRAARLGAAIGKTLGLLARPWLGAATRRVRIALPKATPREARRIVRKSIALQARYAAEAARAAALGVAVERLDCAPDIEQAIVDAVSAPGPTLLVSAHLGPWERVARTLVALGVDLVAVARQSYDPRFSRIYGRLRGASGVRWLYRGRPRAVRRMLDVLRQGRVLGVPMDLRSRVPSIESTLLGQLAWTAIGPAKLALRTGARVIVVTASRPRDRGMSPGLAFSAVESHDLQRGSAGEAELTRRINLALSAHIRAWPEGWVWVHDRFRTLRASGTIGGDTVASARPLLAP